MKTCPYCQQKLSDNLLRCSYCRKAYPGNINIVKPIKNIEGDYPVWTLNESGIFLVVMCIMFFISSFIIGVIYELFYTGHELILFLNNPLYTILPFSTTEALMVVSIYMVFYKRYKIDFFKELKLIKPEKFNIFIFVSLLIAVLLSGFIMMMRMPKEGLKIAQFTPLMVYSFIFVAIIIAPFCEEVCFRGYLYPAINRRWGMNKSIFITSIVFASVHFNYWDHFPALIQILFLSLAITYLRAVTKSTLVAVIFHFLYNLSISILYLSISDLYWVIV